MHPGALRQGQALCGGAARAARGGVRRVAGVRRHASASAIIAAPATHRRRGPPRAPGCAVAATCRFCPAGLAGRWCCRGPPRSKSPRHAWELQASVSAGWAGSSFSVVRALGRSRAGWCNALVRRFVTRTPQAPRNVILGTGHPLSLGQAPRLARLRGSSPRRARAARARSGKRAAPFPALYTPAGHVLTPRPWPASICCSAPPARGR